MPIETTRDPEQTRERLAEWIAARRPGARDVAVSEIGGPAATGYSHETILFRAVWREGDDRRDERLVARVAPTSHTVFLDPDFETEYRVTRALSESGTAPVARVVAYEAEPSWVGAPFTVVAQVDGLIPPDNPPYTFGGWLLEASPEDQARVWWSGIGAMAAVHRADPHALGLDFLAGTGLGAPGMDAQLAYWDRYAAWLGAAPLPPAVAAARDWLGANRPAGARRALLWGDARLGNQIHRDYSCVALLDWEMAAIGDPALDLGWWLYFDRVFSDGLGVSRPPGFPSHEETLERYEEIAGAPVRDVAYYEVFAGFRFALIMMRLGQLLVLTEKIPPDSEFGTNGFAVQFLARVLGEQGAAVTG